MNTEEVLKTYNRIISDLYEVVRIQRDRIKSLEGDLSPAREKFDLRSMNQNLLKGNTRMKKN